MSILRFDFRKVCIILLLLIWVIHPQTSMAHSINGTITGRYNKKVERWRPVVKKYLKYYRIYSKEKEGRILNMIKHESGGSPTARSGRHSGLLQFTPSWKHNYSKRYFKQYGLQDYKLDNRLSGYWSIRRICKVYKQGGVKKVKQHWRATYNK